MYINFKGHLNNTDYIKYSCNNKGICCNVNHMSSFIYKIDENKENIKNKKKIKNKEKIKNKPKTKNIDNFVISFF